MRANLKTQLRNIHSSGLQAAEINKEIVLASVAKDWGDFFEHAVFAEDFTEDSTKEYLGNFHWDVIGRIHFFDLLCRSTGGLPSYALEMCPMELMEFLEDRVDMQSMFERFVKQNNRNNKVEVARAKRRANRKT